MATTKSTTTRRRTAKPRSTAAKADKSLPARTARTIKERPYTSAAIATGAVTAVAAVAAAAVGAFFFSRREQSLRETSDELATKIKGRLSDTGERIKDLASRGSELFKGGDEPRTQQQIAEEALTLKETGASAGQATDPVIEGQLKAGAISY